MNNSQFKSPRPFLLKDEEKSTHERYDIRTRTSATSSTVNPRSLYPSVDRDSQSPAGLGWEDGTDESSQDPRLSYARNRHSVLSALRQNFVVAWTQGVKYTGYIILYIVTGLALIAAWALPHNAAWQTPILLTMSIVLTIFSSPATVKMLLFLLIAPWYELFLVKRRQSQQHDPSFQPLVSILIPGWNEEVGLVATIKTVLASSYRSLEIVVVNDGSTDNSDAVMKRFLEQYTWAMRHVPSATPILYHYQQNAGKAVALNTAIALSHGEIVVSIDADCVMDKDCIASFVESMHDPSIMAACGNVKVGNPGHVLSHVQLVEYAASFYARQADALLGTLYVISGAAGAFRRTVFDVVGTYGTALRGGGEDVDLSIRVQQAGMKIAYCPGAIVYTEVPTTLQGLVKQRKRWTFSRFVTFKTYKSLIFNTKNEHNKLLTCLVIPLIIINDWLYIIKMVLKVGLYIVALATGTFQVLTMLIILSMIISGLPLLKDRDYRIYLLLTPITWILSLIPAFIEMYAVASAIHNLLRNREVKWQSWQRNGALKSVKR